MSPTSSRQYRTARWQALLSLGLGVALLFCAWQWWRVAQFNRYIEANDLASAERWAVPSQLQFLQALAADRNSFLDEASEQYSAYASDGQTTLWSVARYNLAGVYLRQAVELELAEKQDGRAVLIELAKLHYRALLRQHPGHRDAAHNLALALALQPDVIAASVPDLDAMPERSPQSPVTAAGRERLP